MKTLIAVTAVSLAAMWWSSPAVAQVPGPGPWVQPLAYSYAAEEPAAAALSGKPACEEGCPSECGTPVCEGKWVATVDMILLNRHNGRTQTLVSTGSGAPLVGIKDMDFDYQLAPRASLIRKDFHNDWDLEVGYFGIDGWNDHQTVFNTAGTLFTAPGFTATANPPTSMDIRYQSRLYSAEANLRRELGYEWTFLAGLRWIELGEGFSAQRVGGATELNFWHTEAMNHLFGLQIGGEKMLWAGQSGRLRIDASVKAGAYLNHASQRSQGPRDGYAEIGAMDDAAAFVGEAALTSSYQLNCRWAVRGGWQGMWMESLALAPAQIRTTNLPAGVAAVDMRGGIFAQGGFLGLEANF